MTTLYIKRHKLTGMLYFGKTTRHDVHVYKGSGVRWLNHIKKHGSELVETVWVSEFDNQADLVEFALAFSELFDIVKSTAWANLKEENGLDGSPKGVVFSEEHRMKISANTTGKKKHLTRPPRRTPEGNANRARALTGRKRTEAECAAISRGKLGKTFSEEHKNKLSEAAKKRVRKPHTEETKRKMSEAKLKYKMSGE